MKLVTAVVRPHAWEAFRSAVEVSGVTGMTVNAASRSAADEVSLAPGLRVEIVVEDDQVEAVVQQLAFASGVAAALQPDVWVVPVQRLVRVRPDPRR